MIECFAYAKNEQPESAQSAAADSVLLTFAQRQKSRAQAVTQTGKKISWFLERGYVLADGDQLLGKQGEHITVVAAPETLSEVVSQDLLLLTRAAYHLGNRHVPLQINTGSLRYQHDHVLDAMVVGLGLSVACVEKSFQPENGAYHGTAGAHDHGHSHGHSHEKHDHDKHSHDSHHHG